MTWVFTQAMFLTINAILWSLSYAEIRVEHPREEVQGHLDVALRCIKQASERWPGVASAFELYTTLIAACMQIYEKAGDVYISAASPADTTINEGPNRSQTTSPVAQPAPSMENTSPAVQAIALETAQRAYSAGIDTPKQPPMERRSLPPSVPKHEFPTTGSFGMAAAMQTHHPQNHGGFVPNSHGHISQAPHGFSDSALDSSHAQFPLPATFPSMAGWDPTFDFAQNAQNRTMAPGLFSFEQVGTANDPQNAIPYSDYLYPPSWDMPDRQATAGLNREEQSELMQSLEDTGGVLELMINATERVFDPRAGR